MDRPATLGRTTADRSRAAGLKEILAEWCAVRLGSEPAGTLFESGKLASVHGLTLADGRSVVVKVRPSQPRLLGTWQVQRHLYENGFPCPAPLAPPSPIAQDLVASAEALVEGTPLPRVPSDGAQRYAALLFELIETAPPAGSVSPLLPPPEWVWWDHPFPGLWPPADDRAGDLNSGRGGGSRLREVGLRLRERLAASGQLPAVVGHADFESQNIRWTPRLEVAAVDDWDSVTSGPECLFAGAAAAVWTADGTPGAASVEQTADFLMAYNQLRREPMTAGEVELAWAAGLWVRTFNAVKDLADGLGDTLPQDEADQRLRRAGA
jgi:hypothetical protein